MTDALRHLSSQYEPSDSTAYSEEELRTVYMDLLAHDEPTQDVTEPTEVQMNVEDVERMLDGLAQRLLRTESVMSGEVDADSRKDSAFLRRMQDRLSTAGHAESSPTFSSSSRLDTVEDERNDSPSVEPLHRRILSPLEAMVSRIEGITIPLSSSSLDNYETSTKKGKSPATLPISILSNTEWQALIYRCVSFFFLVILLLFVSKN